MLDLSPVALLFLLQTYDVGPFAKPAPETQFRELKQADSTGSTLRLAREDWERARELVRRDPEWRAWLAQRKAEVDDWMQRRRDRVEWVAGWWHDFVSPKDGSYLTWTPDEPGEWTLQSPSDARVQLTPKIHGGWVFVFRSRHTEKVLESARLYRLTGQQKYADWAASQIDFYTNNYLKWPLQTAKLKARLMHQSLDDANVLIRLVQAARLLDVDEGRRATWIDKLFRPEAELLDETMQSIHNIACWQRSAMAQAAIFARDAALWKRAIDGPYGIRKQVAHGITSEYLWFEQSLLYNNYVVSALLPLFVMASLEGRAGELRSEMHAAENMMLAPIYLRFPTGQLPNPADATQGMRQAPALSLMAQAYRVFPTALGLREAAKQQSWETLLDPPEPPSTRNTPLPEVVSRDWSSSRMAVLREGAWQVFVHYGQLHRSHAQAEALHFEAFFGTTDITHDPGTVGYGSPLHRGFYQTGAAHNVPLINRAGQATWKPGRLVAFSSDRIRAEQPEYRPDGSASRDLWIRDNMLVDEVSVVSKSADPVELGLVLHLQGDISGPEQARSTPCALPYWTDCRQATYQEQAEFGVVFGKLRMNVAMATSGSFTVQFGRSPDMPPGTRSSVYLFKTGQQAKFLTTIRPD